RATCWYRSRSYAPAAYASPSCASAASLTPIRRTSSAAELVTGTLWPPRASRPRRRCQLPAGPSAAAGITDPHGLDVAELADAVVRELPAETGSLDAAERQLRV